MIITFSMKNFNEAYERFMVDFKIHSSGRNVTPKKLEQHLGLVQIANIQDNGHYVAYKVVDFEKYKIGRHRYNLF